MRRDYDIFEQFADGSTLWRACVNGRYNAIRKMYEIAEHSDNRFLIIDIQANSFLRITTKDDPVIVLAKGAHG